MKWPSHWTSEGTAVSPRRACWVSSRPYVHTLMLTVGRAYERKRRARLQKELWSLAEGPGAETLNGTDVKRFSWTTQHVSVQKNLSSEWPQTRLCSLHPGPCVGSVRGRLFAGTSGPTHFSFPPLNSCPRTSDGRASSRSPRSLLGPLLCLWLSFSCCQEDPDM